METIIQKALKLLLDKFDAEYDCVMVAEENGHYRASIETPEPSKLIGKNGSLLSAIQTILKVVLWNQQEEKVFVTVDVDNYRGQQEDRAYEKVQKTIDLMREQNLSEIKLHPMRPYQRRLIHVWVANNFSDLQTDSVGEGPQRAVRIFHK